MLRALGLALALVSALNACAAKRPPSLAAEERDRLGRVGAAADRARPVAILSRTDPEAPAPVSAPDGFTEPREDDILETL